MPILRVTGRTEVFDGGAWQAAFVIGWVTLTLGLVIMVWPGKPGQVSEILFALALFLLAGWDAVVAARARIGRGLRVLLYAIAIFVALLGVSCLRSSEWATLLAVWIAMAFTAHGIAQAMVGAWAEDVPDSGRSEVFGLLTLAAGVAVLVWQTRTLTALSLLVGLCVIGLGASQIHLAARFERATAASSGAAVREPPRSPRPAMPRPGPSRGGPVAQRGGT
ncbi:DUF308 domain-containing protein [Nocardia sp. alder85J]|uniref:DUF308 domain-containing protein n=1 Tax=Nocardia sp. alder85J TaxID=2862949 RepID=UPI001CD1F243|nr:DUF308 domain-containing protein [Nocardia sp. alder85J]MCX4091758.1 DUF308 domain-containing protein [Nocardia sp. alder85J]